MIPLDAEFIEADLMSDEEAVTGVVVVAVVVVVAWALEFSTLDDVCIWVLFMVVLVCVVMLEFGV